MDPRHLQLGCQSRLAILEHRDLRRGAPHIEADQIVVTAILAVVRSGDRAGRRSRFDEVHRKLAGLLGSGEPPIGLHDVKRRLIAFRGNALDQSSEILFHARLDVGVGDRRAHPFVFANFRLHPSRDADQCGIEGFSGDLGYPLFMCRIRRRMHEAHRQGLNLGFLEFADRPTHIRFVKGHVDRSIGQHPFGDTLAEAAWDQRRRKFRRKIQVVVTSLAAHLEHVAEARCGDQPHPCAGILDNDVGRQRRRVDEDAHLFRRDLETIPYGFQTLEHGSAGIFRGREHLETQKISSAGVEDNEVRKCPADVDADPILAFHSTPYSSHKDPGGAVPSQPDPRPRSLSRSRLRSRRRASPSYLPGHEGGGACVNVSA